MIYRNRDGNTVYSYTKEEREAALNVSLSALASYLGYTVIRAGNHPHLKEMDSLVLYNDRSWTRWSKKGEITGGTQIDFMRAFGGAKDVPEAIAKLLEFAGSGMAEAPPLESFHHNDNKNKGKMVLPPKHSNYRRLFAYLIKTRGISQETIADFVHRGLIYEDAKHHNIVFVGMDPEGVPRYAGLRGTADIYGKPFKMDVFGNDKNYGVNIVNKDSDEIKVFESVIDCMSYIDLTGDTVSNKIVLGMVEDNPLEQFLNDYDHIKNISFCLDNDTAGQEAVYGNSKAGRKGLANKYYYKGYNVSVEKPPEGKDFNDSLLFMRNEKIKLPIDIKKKSFNGDVEMKNIKEKDPILIWDIVHECDDEFDNPTEWSATLRNGDASLYYWVDLEDGKYNAYDRYNSHSPINERAFKSLKAAQSWVEDVAIPFFTKDVITGLYLDAIEKESFISLGSGKWFIDTVYAMDNGFLCNQVKIYDDKLSLYKVVVVNSDDAKDVLESILSVIEGIGYRDVYPIQYFNVPISSVKLSEDGEIVITDLSSLYHQSPDCREFYTLKDYCKYYLPPADFVGKDCLSAYVDYENSIMRTYYDRKGFLEQDTAYAVSRGKGELIKEWGANIAAEEHIIEKELAVKIADRFVSIQETEGGYDYSIYNEGYKLLDGGVWDNPDITIREALEYIIRDDLQEPGYNPQTEQYYRRTLQGNVYIGDVPEFIDFDKFMEKVERVGQEEIAEIHQKAEMDDMMKLAAEIDNFCKYFDFYEYMDSVVNRKTSVNLIADLLRKGDVEHIKDYLKEIIDNNEAGIDLLEASRLFSLVKDIDLSDRINSFELDKNDKEEKPEIDHLEDNYDNKKENAVKKSIRR